MLAEGLAAGTAVFQWLIQHRWGVVIVLVLTHVGAFVLGGWLRPDPTVDVPTPVEVTHDVTPVELDAVDHEARAAALAEELAELEAEATAELEQVRAAYEALRRRAGPVEFHELEALEGRLEQLRDRL